MIHLGKYDDNGTEVTHHRKMEQKLTCDITSNKLFYTHPPIGRDIFIYFCKLKPSYILCTNVFLIKTGLRHTYYIEVAN